MSGKLENRQCARLLLVLLRPLKPNPPDSLSFLWMQVHRSCCLCCFVFLQLTWQFWGESWETLGEMQTWRGGGRIRKASGWNKRSRRAKASPSSPWCCSSRLWARRSPPPSPAAAPCRRSAPWSARQTPEEGRNKEKRGQHHTTLCNSPARWCNAAHKAEFDGCKHWVMKI